MRSSSTISPSPCLPLSPSSLRPADRRHHSPHHCRHSRLLPHPPPARPQLRRRHLLSPLAPLALASLAHHATSRRRLAIKNALGPRAGDRPPCHQRLLRHLRRRQPLVPPLDLRLLDLHGLDQLLICNRAIKRRGAGGRRDKY